MSSEFSLQSIKPLAGRALQEALNRLLQLDEVSLQQLQALDGRRIELHLQEPTLALAITVQNQKLLVGPVVENQEADLSLKSKLSGILQSLPLFANGKPAIGAMRISGDVELARIVQNLAKDFSPNWQAPFIQAFGPVLGPQALKVIRDGIQQARVSVKNFVQSGAEYVTEEARVVVGKAELNDFNNQVDALRQHADRLQARVSNILKENEK